MPSTPFYRIYEEEWEIFTVSSVLAADLAVEKTDCRGLITILVQVTDAAKLGRIVRIARMIGF